MTCFYDRYTKLTIYSPTCEKKIVITSDELSIYFRTSRWTSGEDADSFGATIDNSVVAEIEIFNLSDDTISKIEHEDAYTKTGGSTITLESGYRGHSGVIFTGTVAHMEKDFSGVDMGIVLKCRESKAIVKNMVVNVTYTSGMLLTDIVESLAVKSNLSIAQIDPSTVVCKARTYSPTKSLDTIFTELAIECGFTYEFKHGALYFLDMGNRMKTIYDLTPETGLLSATLTRNPAYTNDSYDVVALMLPNIEWLSGVKIDDYVCSVTTKPVHISNGEEHCTKFLATVGQISPNLKRSIGFGGSW